MSSVNTTKIESGERPKYLTFGAGVTAATANGNSDPAAKTSPYTSFQVIATTTAGNVTATVQIQVSNDDSYVNWLNYGTAITIVSGASPQTGGFPLVAADMGAAVPWRWVRAVVSNLTGTGAACQILMGY